MISSFGVMLTLCCDFGADQRFSLNAVRVFGMAMAQQCRQIKDVMIIEKESHQPEEKQY